MGKAGSEAGWRHTRCRRGAVVSGPSATGRLEKLAVEVLTALRDVTP
jgi:hypothetical protein